jgi:malate dehydrogenase (oxaloacetate-decarboxylating)(NADP+)
MQRAFNNHILSTLPIPYLLSIRPLTCYSILSLSFAKSLMHYSIHTLLLFLLFLAYSPWVAEPCKEIHKDKNDVYKYTNKGNLVAVISNGTAVLGLGNLGPEASKPVMEGKAVLFKRFAQVDAFDIEINTFDPEEIVRTVEILEPTFGGVNLEDIKAPECFYIEEECKRRMNIPVFHDDQHGTAIVAAAGLLNACELVGKEMSSIKINISGAGASAISCARLFIRLGVNPNNVLMVDSRGVIYKGREGLNKQKEEFAVETTARTLADTFKGSDVFVGLSVGGLVSKEMLLDMNVNPIIFAMANPDPEITPPDAYLARQDIIIATGRTDYPNQINNVLGFPFIFRGALDVAATSVNEEMKVAATMALAKLAKLGAPQEVAEKHNRKELTFGRDYIVPSPFDPRVLVHESYAVAKAAMETGVARTNIDLAEYKQRLEKMANVEPQEL